MGKLLTTVLLLLVISSQVYAQDSQDNKRKKVADEAGQVDQLKQQLATGKFYFEAEWATSSSGNRINLFSNPNYLSLDKLHAEAMLPFFGVAHSIAFGQGGIKIDNEIMEYETQFSDRKKRTTISFSVKNKTELFDITLTVFDNNNVSVVINSNYRSSITYSGKLIEKEELN